MMRRGFRSSFTWLRAPVLGTFLVLGYLLLPPQVDRRLQTGFTPGHPTNSDLCVPSPSAEKIVVAIKTGATEAEEKIPIQMQTTLRCVKNLLFFSDLEQTLGQYHLYDALDAVSASVADNNTDFNFYRKQQQLWRSDRNISILQGVRNPDCPDDLAAWTLDKYKNIHILEKTWAMKPDMDWYIFIDADTYIFWSNLLMWLNTLDPMKKSYFGSEVSISGVRFAHGGSGYVLSRAVMHELVAIHNGTAARWDPEIHDECCGDLMLGRALEEYGTVLQDVWPLMSGETLSTMPFGPGTPEYWCHPALSMHHLTPSDMKALTAFEGRRLNKSEPLTHVEIFNNLVMNSLPSYRENWDNLASEPGEFGKTGGVSVSAASFEECGQACEADMNCFQYSHHNQTCHIGMSVRLGCRKEPEEVWIWQSGWNKTRLSDWVSRQPLCNQITFPEQVAPE